MTKKKLVAIAVVIFALIAVMLCSCTYNVQKSEDEQIGDERFVADKAMEGSIIVTDTETGVQYLFVKHGYGGGLTVLVDENGKPLVKEASVDD